MLEKIRNTVKDLPEVSDWRLQTVETASSELFYVGKKLETNRATDITKYSLTVYTDREGKRGSATFPVYGFYSDAELREKIEENLFAAGFAMNPCYDLPSPEDVEIPESESNIGEIGLKEAAEIVSDAVFKADAYKDGYLSATEIFIERKNVRITNSRGVDLSMVTWLGSVELIPSWEKDGEEVEIYHMMHFESIDPEAITKKVDEKLRVAAARFEAKPLSEVIDLSKPVKVLVQDDETAEILAYFADDLNYAEKYMKSNKFELGDNVQGAIVTGTKLTMSMAPYVKGASRSAFFDADGVVGKETPIVKEGIAVGRTGAYRFGQYLGIEKPAGSLPIIVVAPGTKPFSEMAKEPYLRCAVFSGIQVERNSGYFGGEVRLGYYFDGEKEIPVTSFTISGDLNVSRGTMVYSSDTVTTDFYHGPKYLEIRDMKLA